jgi:hypothetical protein
MSAHCPTTDYSEGCRDIPDSFVRKVPYEPLALHLLSDYFCHLFDAADEIDNIRRST